MEWTDDISDAPVRQIGVSGNQTGLHRWEFIAFTTEPQLLLLNVLGFSCALPM